MPLDPAPVTLITAVLAADEVPAIHFAETEDQIPELDLTERDIRLLRVDARDVDSKSLLWERFRAGDLNFLGPGGSWDAMMEIFRDYVEDFVPGRGYVLVIRNAASFIRANPALAIFLIQVWLWIVEDREPRIPLHLVFVLEDA